LYYNECSQEGVISSIIIDGYNIIGISHKDLKKQRDEFIDSLIEYRKRRGHEITVVFDGWKTGEAQESRTKVGGISIIYSRIGEKADAVIKRIISLQRSGWIVVTSDRDIANHAWASGSVPVSGEDFLRVFESQSPSHSDREEQEEDEYRDIRKKGSPRKLSKKEKAIRRALNKL
jgi:predicted RNA-binding protein with PIN domain